MTTFSAECATAPSDARVIADAVRDPGAFVTVFDRYHPTVHRYLSRRVGAQVADDLASETFTRALAQVALFDATAASARPWLLGIATNLVHRHHRDEARFLRALARSGAAAAVDHDEAMAELADSRVSAQRWSMPLAKALLGLAERDRDTLLLFAWEGMSYQEIAAALGIPLGTVRSRLNRCRARLRKALGVLDPRILDEDPQSEMRHP